MRAAIYNPYLDTLGGGERYTISFAKALSDLGYRCDVQWQNEKIRSRLEERFGMKLGSINFIPDIKKGEGYDVCFWVSDGSIPLLHSRHNILHFQIPFRDVNGGSLLNKMKLFRINKVVCNSLFTKRIVDAEYGINSVVVYPPVDTVNIKPKKKENIILNISRFSDLTQAKRQDVLVETFIKLCKKGVKDWKLVLAGGVEVGVGASVDKLLKSARGFPVEIIKSPSFQRVKDLYGSSKIFWSASGYGFDEEKNPQKVEHFGISVVEAMSAKAIPIVFSAGGHKEIVEDKENGFLWSTPRELLRLTQEVIVTASKIRQIKDNAWHDSQRFSYENFAKRVSEIIG